MRFCDRPGSLCQRQIERLIEMHFQKANTANAACIQEFPMALSKQWLLFHRHLSLQGPQHTSEELAVLFFHEIIAREMDIDAPASQLRVDLPEGAHIIRPHEYVADPCEILEMFQVIEMVLEPTATANLRQVVCLVHNDGEWLAVNERFFHGFPHGSHANGSRFAVHKRIPQLAQHRFVVMSIIKAT